MDTNDKIASLAFRGTAERTWSIHVVAAVVVVLGFATSLRAADKPNFVWLISEDNSLHYLKLFDETGAETPRIAELAAEGLIFDNAYSNSPVCSVARSTLITSCL
ncbi:MAG: sulfatase-like hydrolase/transferase, partial [Deltaproteobacteria bacterium]|nr:sulfatase-like hydrolase/transferase [Deltaproteobacteria bacterium]